MEAVEKQLILIVGVYEGRSCLVGKYRARKCELMAFRRGKVNYCGTEITLDNMFFSILPNGLVELNRVCEKNLCHIHGVSRLTPSAPRINSVWVLTRIKLLLRIKSRLGTSGLMSVVFLCTCCILCVEHTAGLKSLQSDFSCWKISVSLQWCVSGDTRGMDRISRLVQSFCVTVKGLGVASCSYWEVSSLVLKPKLLYFYFIVFLLYSFIHIFV